MLLHLVQLYTSKPAFEANSILQILSKCPVCQHSKYKLWMGIHMEWSSTYINSSALGLTFSVV